MIIRWNDFTMLVLSWCCLDTSPDFMSSCSMVTELPETYVSHESDFLTFEALAVRPSKPMCWALVAVICSLVLSNEAEKGSTSRALKPGVFAFAMLAATVACRVESHWLCRDARSNKWTGDVKMASKGVSPLSSRSTLRGAVLLRPVLQKTKLLK